MELILLVGGDSLTLTVISSNSALAYGIRVLLVLPHRYQANILKYPLHKKFTSLQLIIYENSARFFILGNNQFLKLMGIWCYPYKIKYKKKHPPKLEKFSVVAGYSLNRFRTTRVHLTSD
ncbi:hypothetical protein QRE66_27830 (plasmid) [Bacillus cereus]|nr:hypothetical protein QRE66_27830 [Bacillus cereus]